MSSAILFHKLATRILAVQRPHPLRVAFDGVDAAGKTTLADGLAAFLPGLTSRRIIRSSIDHFHNPREVRYRQGPDSPEGYYQDSFNLAEFRRSLLDPLGPGGSRVIRTALFDFRANASVQREPIQVEENAILLLDGIFLMRPELAGCFDFTIFVQVSFETVLKRVVERDRDYLGDEQAVIQKYRRRYIPAQRHYLETCKPRERADVVVENDDPAHPTLFHNFLEP